MTGRPEMRGPAPTLASGNRAEVIRNELPCTIAKPQPEADFAALYLARRYRLALPLAQAVAALAGLGRAFG
jgi:hypothetical protein